jgi:hypothetical protein
MKKIFCILVCGLIISKGIAQKSVEIRSIDSLTEKIRTYISEPRPGMHIFGDKIDAKDDFPAAFYMDTAKGQLLAVVQNELFTIEKDSTDPRDTEETDTLTYTYYFFDNKLLKISVQKNIGQPDMVDAIFYFKESNPIHKISISEGKTTVIDGEDDITPMMVKRSEILLKRSRRVLR